MDLKIVLSAQKESVSTQAHSLPNEGARGKISVQQDRQLGVCIAPKSMNKR
jgi:hypothetical protein